MMRENGKLDLAGEFRAYSRRIRSDYDMTAPSSSDPGSTGRKREDILREFLTRNLPEIMGVSEGCVFDRERSMSRQCDIVVYSKMALCLREERMRLFPIDSVLAVGEVKSHLSRSHISDAVGKIRAVKRMKLRPSKVRFGGFHDRSLGCLFSFHADSKSTVSNNLFEEYQSQSVPYEEEVDLIYVHDSMIGLKKPSDLGLSLEDEGGDHSSSDFVWLGSKEDSLIVLLFLLVNSMNDPVNLSRDFLPYLSSVGVDFTITDVRRGRSTEQIPDSSQEP